eukprot:Lankesteria_metandrocarpae@DN5263_c0_g1_i1.p1
MNSMHNNAPRGRRLPQPIMDRHHQGSGGGGGRMRMVSRSRSRGRHPAVAGGPVDNVGISGGMRMNSTGVARSVSPPSLSGIRGMMEGGNEEGMGGYMILGRSQMPPPGYQQRVVAEFSGSPRGRYSPVDSRSRFRRIGGTHGSPTSSHSPPRYYPGRGRIKHAATVPVTHSRRMPEKGLSVMEMGHLSDDLSPHRRGMGVEVHRDIRYRAGPFNPGSVPVKSMALDGRINASSIGAVDCRSPNSRGGPPGAVPRGAGDDSMHKHRYGHGGMGPGGEPYVDSRGGPPGSVRGMGGTGTPVGVQPRRATLTPRVSDSAEKRIPSSGRRYNERYGNDNPNRPNSGRGVEPVRRNRSVMNDDVPSPVSSSAQYPNHSGSSSGGGMWRRNVAGGGVWLRSPPSHHVGGGAVVCRPYAKPMPSNRTDDMLASRVQDLQVRLDEMASENQVFRQVILDQTTRVWKLSQIVSRRGVDFCDDLSELSAQALQRPSSAYRRSRKWRLVGGARANTILTADSTDCVDGPNSSSQPQNAHDSTEYQIDANCDVGAEVVGSSGENTAAISCITTVASAADAEDTQGVDVAAVGDNFAVGDPATAGDGGCAVVLTTDANGDNTIDTTAVAVNVAGGDGGDPTSTGSVTPSVMQEKLGNSAVTSSTSTYSRQRVASIDSRRMAAPAAKRVATEAGKLSSSEAAVNEKEDSDGVLATTGQLCIDHHGQSTTNLDTVTDTDEKQESDESRYLPFGKLSSVPKYDMTSPQSSLRTPSVYWVNCQTPCVDYEFRTIAEALIDVPPHSTILIREGLYIESITITNPIRLIGVGCDVQLLSDKGNGITVKCEGAVVQNMHIRCEYREFSLVHALDGEASRGLTSVSPCLSGVSSGPGVGLMGNHCVSIYAESFELDGCDLMTDRGHCIYCDPFGSANSNRYGQKDRRSTAGSAAGSGLADGDASMLSPTGVGALSNNDNLLVVGTGGPQQVAMSERVVSGSSADDLVVDEYTAVDDEGDSLNCEADSSHSRLVHNDGPFSNCPLSANSKAGAKESGSDASHDVDAAVGAMGDGSTEETASFVNDDEAAANNRSTPDKSRTMMISDESHMGPNRNMTEHENTADGEEFTDAPADDENSTIRSTEGDGNTNNGRGGSMNDELAVLDNITGGVLDGNNPEGTATGNTYQSCGDEADSVSSDVVEVVDFPNCTDQDAMMNTESSIGDPDDHQQQHHPSSSGRMHNASGANSSAGDNVGYVTPVNSSSTIVEEFNPEKFFAPPSAEGYPKGAIVCRNSRIHHASSCGLFVTGRCRVNIDNTAIEACRMAGVEARDRARVTMSKCRITACTKSGVFGHGSAHVALQATDVISCGMAGVELSKQSTGSLLDSRIYQGQKGGVFVHDYARASIKKCEVFANAMSNVDIRAHGKVEVIDSTISESKTSGVYVSNKGEAFLHRNFICRNWGNGVELNTASLTAYHNQVHENHRCALFANGDCGGVIHHNDFRWNSDKSLNNHSRGRLPADGDNNFVDSGDRRSNNN